MLLAVPVCGQGYGDEWLSNFTVDDSVEHTGFASSADKVYARVLEYIKTNYPEERIKVWSTGFSRAAAVSNVLGARLLSDSSFNEDDIFVYTFGTPNTTREPLETTHIYNICGSFDPVPHVPFKEWGFGKNGVTLYLPAKETDIDYTSWTEDARAVYTQVMGSDEGFDSITERNWLLTKILDLACEALPTAKDYSSEVQAAVIAAWKTKGNAMNKLEKLLDVMQSEGAEGFEVDETVFSHVLGELQTLASVGVTDTVKSLTGQGGSSIWYELLTSGLSLAHEHFPEEYFAWINATDDADLLFSQGSSYNRLVYTGSMDLRVEMTDAESGTTAVLMDSANNLSSLATAVLNNQTFVYLPSGYQYTITLEQKDEEGLCQVGFSYADVAEASIPLYTVNAITLYQLETITINVPKNADEEHPVTVLLDEAVELPLFSGAEGGAYQDLLMEGNNAGKDLAGMISNAVVVVPYLFSAAVLLLYAIAVAIKRAARHRVNDTASCRLPGKILLIAAAVIAFALCVEPVRSLYAGLTGTPAAAGISNRTLRRVSEYLGWGTNIYQGSVLVICFLEGYLCLRSIGHYLNRIRLVRLSCLMLLLNTIALFMSAYQNTNSWNDELGILVPIAALIGLRLARVRTDEDRNIGKHWLPVTRAVTWTALLFLTRQALIIIFDETSLLTVVLKMLAGVPVFVMALGMARRCKDGLHRLMAAAMGCYMAANAIINVSLRWGICVYLVGHILLIIAFVREHRPTKLQYIAWPIVSAVFVAELFLFRQYIPADLLSFGCVYTVLMAAMLVASVPVSSRLRVGTLSFALANELLVLTFIANSFVLESAELLIYYIAVLIMSADPAALLNGAEAKHLEEMLEE